MKMKIGLLTIGQTSRRDVISEIRAILGPGVDIIEGGALDGMGEKDIKKLRPEKGDFPLITKLMDGSSVVVGRKNILPLLKKKLKELEQMNVRFIGLLCTDEFPEIGSQMPFLLPSRLLFHTVISVREKGRLGVFVPLEQQKEGCKRKWEETGLGVFVEPLNPYRVSKQEAKSIARMKRAEVDLVVLDCIGYSQKMKNKIGRAIQKPVLLPRTILARMISELMGKG